MSIKVIIAPAGSGKTAWVEERSRELSSGLVNTPRVVVPSRMQAVAFRKRSAQQGGAIGVQVGTFEDLSQEILNLAAIHRTRLSKIAQVRLLKVIFNDCDLEYYDGIKDLPGFVQVMQKIINELKSGGIQPDQFTAAVKGMGGNPRIEEIAKIYSGYQSTLVKEEWSDYIGEIWLAAEALESIPDLCSTWTTLFVDGFDDLSPVQLRIILALEKQVPDISITLTGTKPGIERSLVHKRFQRTLSLLNASADPELITLEDLVNYDMQNSLISKLEGAIFQVKDNKKLKNDQDLDMVAVPDREAEVRTALRWVKSLIVREGFYPEGITILTRNLEPYRPLLVRVAFEYGIPIHVQGGFPLNENPVIAAILNIIKLIQPGKEYLNWRGVIEAWRSPYFNWDCLIDIDDEAHRKEVHLKDAEQLGCIARWGSIIRGYQQWEEVFSQLVSEKVFDEVAMGEEANRLWKKFQKFSVVLTPPAGEVHLSEFIFWLENLLGDEDKQDNSLSLGVIEKITEGPQDLVHRDLQAIRTLKKIFKELVWAENSLQSNSGSFGKFAEDIQGIINQTSYQPEENHFSGVYCADVSEARGIPFRAAAILGLAEGEFPQTIKEDPFLRDSDRAILRDKFNLPLRQSTDSAEAEYFYEAITRAYDRILITRPRIADNGSPWQPSPYWEEILRCVDVTPQVLTSRSKPALVSASSDHELLEIISADAAEGKSWKWAEENLSGSIGRINHAQRVLASRSNRENSSGDIYDGGLTILSDYFSNRFDEEQIWSASRLETYQACPYYFFVANVLGLERMEPPREGLDARQLGNIYHHILEDLYQGAGDKPNLQQLQGKLPEVAEIVFDQAPQRESFRVTAWWLHTQKEILTNLNRSLVVLETLNLAYNFFQAEQKFGIGKSSETALKAVTRDGNYFLLRGFIDRVDKNPSGSIRIIDYKTSSSYGFTNQAVREGKKLQLPLYALAAEQALNLGIVQEGFYFHVRNAEPSGIKLSSFKMNANSGPKTAMENAVEISWRSIQAIQRGKFEPQVPAGGCPEYCPAAEFCWHYRSKQW